MLLCVAEGFSAVYAKAHAVIRLRKAPEEIEEGAAFPRSRSIFRLVSATDACILLCYLQAGCGAAPAQLNA
jgi:hypothetical protein